MNITLPWNPMDGGSAAPWTVPNSPWVEPPYMPPLTWPRRPYEEIVNDNLRDEITELREENEKLQRENEKLREKLTNNNISF